MQLYTAAAPNGRRALFVIEELGLPYTLQFLDLARRDQDRPEFRRLNALGHVPVLIDPEGLDGKPITVSQSGAVIFYLARKAGRLIPQDEARRVRAEQLSWMALSDIAAASTTMFLGSKFESGASKGIVDLFRGRMNAYLRYVDDELASRPFLCDELTLADFALLPLVLLPHIWAAIDEIGAENIKRWRNEMMARPAVQRALAISAHH
jgi:GST-like protein